MREEKRIVINLEGDDNKKENKMDDEIIERLRRERKGM